MTTQRPTRPLSRHGAPARCDGDEAHAIQANGTRAVVPYRWHDGGARSPRVSERLAQGRTYQERPRVPAR